MLHKLLFLWLAIIFLPIWTSKQYNRKWWSAFPSSEGSLFWNRFQFCCVFQENESRVHGTRDFIPWAAWAQLQGMRALSRGTECVKSYLCVNERSEVGQSFLCVSEDKTQGNSSLCLDSYFWFFWRKKKSESAIKVEKAKPKEQQMRIMFRNLRQANCCWLFSYKKQTKQIKLFYNFVTASSFWS